MPLILEHRVVERKGTVCKLCTGWYVRSERKVAGRHDGLVVLDLTYIRECRKARCSK